MYIMKYGNVIKPTFDELCRYFDILPNLSYPLTRNKGHLGQPKPKMLFYIIVKAVIIYYTIYVLNVHTMQYCLWLVLDFSIYLFSRNVSLDLGTSMCYCVQAMDIQSAKSVYYQSAYSMLRSPTHTLAYFR